MQKGNEALLLAFAERGTDHSAILRLYEENLPGDKRGQPTQQTVKHETTVASQASRQNTVEVTAWEVARGASGIDGPRPSAEISRTYLISGLAPPQTSASLRIVCKLESEGLEGSLEDEIGGLRLHRELSFYLQPFQLQREAAFVMGLSTVDLSRGGEFDVIASPVDRDASVFAKFGGRNDVRMCLDVLMLGCDMIFTIADETESLVKCRLPNDGEFKQLVDEACNKLGETEVAYEVLRSQFRR